jgi:5-formyltetrahydrofolate cyclo-ligase
MGILEEKRLLRKEMRRAEAGLTAEYIAGASERICAELVSRPEYVGARTVFCFVGMTREVDTSSIMKHAWESGKAVCVPRCAGPVEMEAWRILSMDELRPGRLGILEPTEAAPVVSPEEIDLAIIPCLSCNRRGDRLGRGGGYYDRFLGRYHGRAIMLCMERMTRDRIPMEPGDRTVEAVLTEAGYFLREPGEKE